MDERQFAALHYSLLAAEWQYVHASVEITAPDPAGSEGSEAAELASGELVLVNEERAFQRTRFDLVLESPGHLRLHGPLASLAVTFPQNVVTGTTGEAVSLGPDCFLRCRSLFLNAPSVRILRRSTGGSPSSDVEGTSVVLEVTGEFNCDGMLTGSPPRTAFELRVPPAIQLRHPWVAYRQPLEPAESQPTDRAVRFLNMFMNLVRRHGHSSAWVYDKKLEGRQSVKGDEFQRALSALQGYGVVTYRGSMIGLQAKWEQHRFSGKKVPGQRTIDDKIDVWRPVLDVIAAQLRSNRSLEGR